MYPRLKFVDTSNPREQIIHINEELGEWSEECLKYFKYLDNKIIADPCEVIREAHDVCQSMTTFIRMLCESHNINYDSTLQECIDKGKLRDGRRSDRH